MIIKETFYVGDRQFNRIYSDSNCYVVRDGISYEEACDPVELNREYVEGDPIPQDETAEANAQEILNILLGGRP